MKVCATYPTKLEKSRGVDSSGSDWSQHSGNTLGNTVMCRFKHAELARDDPDHCFAAGPDGGGICGTMCQGYCNLATSPSVCSGELTLFGRERRPCDVDARTADLCRLQVPDSSAHADGERRGARSNRRVASEKRSR